MSPPKNEFTGSFTRPADDGGAVGAPELLVRAGPILAIEIQQPLSLQKILKKSGLEVPRPIQGFGLIDTGASLSVVDQEAVKKLYVQPVGMMDLATAGGDVKQLLYPIRFTFKGEKGDLNVDFERVAGAPLGHVLPIVDEPLIALIGRDVLSLGVLTYDGPQGRFSFSF